MTCRISPSTLAPQAGDRQFRTRPTALMEQVVERMAFAGLAVGMSAWMQGKAAAAASDALGETGQGTANYLIALGIVETVAIFTLVFINNAIK